MRSFIVGLGVGTAVGLLLAPQSGRESRAAVTERAKNWLGKLQNLESGQEPSSDEYRADRAQTVSTESRPALPRANNADAQESESNASRPTEHIPESEAIAEVLNTAKKDELMSVKGIGEATAKRIIKHRPYESGEQVLEENVIPEETLEKVREDLVDRKRDLAS